MHSFCRQSAPRAPIPTRRAGTPSQFVSYSSTHSRDTNSAHESIEHWRKRKVNNFLVFTNPRRLLVSQHACRVNSTKRKRKTTTEKKLQLKKHCPVVLADHRTQKKIKIKIKKKFHRLCFIAFSRLHNTRTRNVKWRTHVEDGVGEIETSENEEHRYEYFERIRSV